MNNELFENIKQHLMDAGRSEYVSKVIASSICFKVHELLEYGIITEKDVEKWVKEYLK